MRSSDLKSNDQVSEIQFWKRSNDQVASSDVQVTGSSDQVASSDQVLSLVIK